MTQPFVGRPREAPLPVPDPSTAAAARRSDRIVLVDNARAIGIVLVVVGHAPGFPKWLIDFIFAFHMPLFFLLSGLLVDAGRLQATTPARIRALARSLLVPYAFYFVVAYGYWLVAKRHGLRALEMEALGWWDPLLGFARGNGDGLYVDVVLWFFPCLFLTAALHHALRKRLSGTTTALVMTCASALFIALHEPGQPRWVWSADCAVVAGAFYAWGSVGSDRVRAGMPDIPVRARATLALIAACACLGLSAVTGSIDLNNLNFGARPLLYLPTAAVGIVGAFAVASMIKPSAVTVWLSSNTLVVFPLHFLVFSVVTGVALRVFDAGPSFKDSIHSGVFYTLVALAACVPAERLIRRAFPWVLTASRRLAGAVEPDGMRRAQSAPAHSGEAHE